MNQTRPPEEPLYSIQETARLLNLRPATLRAWERRFGVPQPRRAANGYRLYSASDLEVLRRLKASIDGGLRIGTAIAYLPGMLVNTSFRLDDLRHRLDESILRFDEHQASLALREALVLHPAETVLAAVIEPMLVGIGEGWRVGRIAVGVEHFASALVVRQLVALYLSAPNPWRPGRGLAACVPGDQHEIGLLAVAVGLRRRGWEVLYLGANLPFEELERAAADLKPAVVLISATRALSDSTLAAIDGLSQRPALQDTDIVLGGLAVRTRQLELSRITVLDGAFGDMLGALETILVRRTHARADQ